MVWKGETVLKELFCFTFVSWYDMYVYPYQIESTSRLSKVLIASLKHKHSSPLYLKKKKIHSLKDLNHMIFSLKEQVYLLLVLLRI